MADKLAYPDMEAHERIRRTAEVSEMKRSGIELKFFEQIQENSKDKSQCKPKNSKLREQ